MAIKTNSIDMVHGPLWGKILKFSLICMLTSLLQIFYNAADVVVVGRFAGQEALAGVGASASVTNLFLNFILGLAAGSTVVLAQAIGEGDKGGDKVSKAAHTAIAVAIFGGLFMMVLCLFFSKLLLTRMDTPENVLPEAVAYLRVMAVGFPASLIYNFGSGILRAKGDTKRALYIVAISGLINVGLNLVFVIVFHMGAAGVALATVISKVFTAVCILYILCRETDQTRIFLHKIRIYKEPFWKIVRLGLPSAIQNSVYSTSNIIVQSTVNSFGSAAIAGNAACTSVTEFYNNMVNSFYQASVVFCSQNYGAKKFERIKKTIGICFVYLLALGAIQSLITYFAGETLLRLYVDANKEPEVLRWALEKFNLIGYTYVFLGFMNIMTGALRGMGRSIVNMIMAIIGVCGIRLLWIFFAFPQIGTFPGLFLCLPLSWIGTFFMHYTMFTIAYRKDKKKFMLEGNVNTVEG